MIVHFEDKDYQFDLDDIDVSQARYLKRKTGMTLMDLEDGLERADPDCLVALYWLMLAQNGKAIDMDKVNFKLVKFGIALRKAAEAEREANPTEELDEATAPEKT
jgi:hypothetical protein